MIETYKSRKKMVRDNFIGFDATTLSRDEIVSHIKSLGYKEFYFKPLAVSHGVYGANGVIVDVITDNDMREEITSFSILARNMTLLSFV